MKKRTFIFCVFQGWLIILCVISPIFLITSRAIADEVHHDLTNTAPDTFTVELLLESNGGTPPYYVLTFGAQQGATDGVDSGLDQLLPPAPPSGRDFEAYFPYDQPNFSLQLVRDIRSDQSLRHVWTIVTRGSEGTMTWYPHTFPRYGTFILDGLTDMRKVTTLDFAYRDTMTIIYNKAEALPDIEIETSSHSFGEVLVSEKRSWSFSISNAGYGDLIIHSVTSDKADFTIDSPDFPKNIEPSRSVIVTLSFVPSIPDSINGAISVRSNDPDEETVTLIVEGIGASPEIEISSSNHDFGEIVVGESSDWELIVYNRGIGDLVIDDISLNNPKFSAAPASFSVSSGDSHEVSVIFVPSIAGPLFGELTIYSNDLDEPTVTVFLAGTGIAPEIELSATSHDFGAVAVGDTGRWILNILNPGGVDLVVDTIASSDPFFAAPPHSFIVSASSAQSVTISFIPSAIQTFEGQLQIASNDPDEPFLTISLEGEGVEEASSDIYVEETGYDFGQVEIEQSSLWKFNVVNLGNAYLEIHDVHTDHPAFSAEPRSLTISPSNLQEVRVTFSPTRVETISTQLIISSNDPDEPTMSLSLAGIGIPGTEIENIYDTSVPGSFHLYQNTPNPFNLSTDIRYQIAEGSSPVHITLIIYNLIGQKVRTLINSEKYSGTYSVHWDGRDEAGDEAGSGIYWYRLRAGSFVESRMMLLLK